jgi:hypothetical protein
LHATSDATRAAIEILENTGLERAGEARSL